MIPASTRQAESSSCRSVCNGADGIAPTTCRSERIASASTSSAARGHGGRHPTIHPCRRTPRSVGRAGAPTARPRGLGTMARSLPTGGGIGADGHPGAGSPHRRDLLEAGGFALAGGPSQADRWSRSTSSGRKARTGPSAATGSIRPCLTAATKASGVRPERRRGRPRHFSAIRLVTGG